ncbi:MAG: ABC transporter permease [Chitinophagaceae bacterium]|jgi:ABC-2 type transport system permease protein
MNKALIVAKREFLSRVQKKTFLLTTIGLPLLIFGFYALIILFTVKNTDDFKIAISDEANVFNKAIVDKKKELVFSYVNSSEDSLKAQLTKGNIDAYVFVPKTFALTTDTDSLKVVSDKSVGLMTREKIERKFENYIEEQRLITGTKMSKEVLDSLQKSNQIVFTTAKGEKDDKAGISYGVGFASGFLIYIVLFIYGSMVMRGVMEEKTNRIAEVIVSSVKPFQLMMGKIVGIGSVGLLQFIIWIVLMMSASTILALISPDTAAQMQNMPVQPGMAQAAQIQNSSAMSGVMASLSTVNWPLIIGCFLFYFLGGYFLYSSLFAAVGSTVNEDPQDAQSLMLPVTLPIIFGIVIMMQAVNNPNSGLAVFGSLFPLTSPIVMVARVAYGVPDGVTTFQLILSMVLLIAGFIGTTWLAGKIYRTGILMYGKKVTLKEVAKWIVRKN